MFRQVIDPPQVPLPLLITGVAGVAGYNALAYFQARYPGQVIGIRQRDNWRLGRTGRGGLQCRRPHAAWPSCSSNISLPPCSIAPATAR